MFNKTFLGILLIVSFSCGKAEDKATVDTFSYSIDTVSVDAKGHIFDLTYSLLKSDYCQQDGYLYTYNEFDHGIDMIDLNQSLS
ncbi:MAG: hypothetical protein WD431_24465 [Cyclobacteriaceae bacterium]